MRELTRNDVDAAAAVLEGTAHRTPVFTSRVLDARLGARLFFKAENLQRCGAFKFRGAYTALSRLDPSARARGVLTWSSGNHAAGLALAGKLLGVPVTIAMPRDAMAIKRDAVLEYGGTIVPCEAAEREVVGREVAREQGLAIIPPYDHDDIIAGQGTVARELLEQVPGLDLVLSPVGGGGLLAGTALAAAVAGGPNVVGVEPEIADDAARSFRAGRIVRLETVPPTIADGLRTRFLGERNFAVIRRHVADIVTVPEAEIVEALRWLWLRMKLVVEPSGATALAAALSGAVDVEGKRIGVLLSGGNADPARVAELLSGAPEAGGR